MTMSEEAVAFGRSQVDLYASYVRDVMPRDGDARSIVEISIVAASAGRRLIDLQQASEDRRF